MSDNRISKEFHEAVIKVKQEEAMLTGYQSGIHNAVAEMRKEFHAELMELADHILAKEAGSVSGERWSFHIRKIAQRHTPRQPEKEGE